MHFSFFHLVLLRHKATALIPTERKLCWHSSSTFTQKSMHALIYSHLHLLIFLSLFAVMLLIVVQEGSLSIQMVGGFGSSSAALCPWWGHLTSLAAHNSTECNNYLVPVTKRHSLF